MKIGLKPLVDSLKSSLKGDLNYEQFIISAVDQFLKRNKEFRGSVVKRYGKKDNYLNAVFSSIESKNYGDAIQLLNSLYNFIFEKTDDINPSDNVNNKNYLVDISSIAYLLIRSESHASEYDINFLAGKHSTCRFEAASKYLVDLYFDILEKITISNEYKEGNHSEFLKKDFFRFTLLSGFYKSICVAKKIIEGEVKLIKEVEYIEELNNYVSPSNQSDKFFPRMFSKTIESETKLAEAPELTSVYSQLISNKNYLDSLINYCRIVRRKNEIDECDYFANSVELIHEWQDTFLQCNSGVNYYNYKYAEVRASGHQIDNRAKHGGKATKRLSRKDKFSSRNFHSKISEKYIENLELDFPILTMFLAWCRGAHPRAGNTIELDGHKFYGGTGIYDQKILHKLIVEKLSKELISKIGQDVEEMSNEH